MLLKNINVFVYLSFKLLSFWRNCMDVYFKKKAGITEDPAEKEAKEAMLKLTGMADSILTRSGNMEVGVVLIVFWFVFQSLRHSCIVVISLFILVKGWFIFTKCFLDVIACDKEYPTGLENFLDTGARNRGKATVKIREKNTTQDSTHDQ